MSNNKSRDPLSRKPLPEKEEAFLAVSSAADKMAREAGCSFHSTIELGMGIIRLGAEYFELDSNAAITDPWAKSFFLELVKVSDYFAINPDGKGIKIEFLFHLWE